MGKVVITIGRQFGSGGHKIGEYLSNRLGLSYYDNELILLAAQRGDLKIEHVEEMDEMIQNPFLFEQQETVVEDSMEETIFQLQQEVIRQIAEKEDAVFVGRCADEALRKAGYRVLSIFISAPLSQRIARTCRLQGISREECEVLTERKDSSRKAYYEKHTGRKWGVPENYDLYYDTSQNDIAYIIVDIIKKYKQMCSE
ncbi:MAG: cytidylate kinase-like family protein [Lachnospiraceae bacterium]|nr:cytidylate kinase-like family protein [Lachnospiraceae bacterium]